MVDTAARKRGVGSVRAGSPAMRGSRSVRSESWCGPARRRAGLVRSGPAWVGGVGGGVVGGGRGAGRPDSDGPFGRTYGTAWHSSAALHGFAPLLVVAHCCRGPRACRRSTLVSARFRDLPAGPGQRGQTRCCRRRRTCGRRGGVLCAAGAPSLRPGMWTIMAVIQALAQRTRSIIVRCRRDRASRAGPAPLGAGPLKMAGRARRHRIFILSPASCGARHSGPAIDSAAARIVSTKSPARRDRSASKWRHNVPNASVASGWDRRKPVRKLNLNAVFRWGLEHGKDRNEMHWPTNARYRRTVNAPAEKGPPSCPVAPAARPSPSFQRNARPSQPALQLPRAPKVLPRLP